MKKIIFSLLAMISLLAASCSNDDIEVQTVGQFRQLTVNVDINSAYDKFGISDFIDYLGDNDQRSIAVITLLYDSNGNKVDSLATFVRTFNKISQTFDEVVDGEYTLVTVATIVNDKKLKAFTLEKTEHLSTLRIESNYTNQYWCNCVCYGHKYISVVGSEVVDVVPEMIGSFVNVSYEGLDKSSYNYFALELKNKSDGYMLDPSLSESLRYYYEKYNSSRYWTSLAYFYVEEGLLDEDWNTFYLLDSGNLQYCFGLSEYSGTGDISFTVFNSSEYNFVPQKSHYAYCYYVGGSKVVETYLGDYAGFKKWYELLESDISSSDIYTPVINWGATVTSVQNDMSSYKMIFGEKGKAEFVDKDMYAIAYEGKGLEDEINYYFSTPSNGLYEVDVWYAATVGEDVLTTYLDNNYVYISEKDGLRMYVTSDYSTVVGLMEVEGKWCVIYMDTNVINSAPEKRDVRTIVSKVEEFKNNLKIRKKLQ